MVDRNLLKIALAAGLTLAICGGTAYESFKNTLTTCRTPNTDFVILPDNLLHEDKSSMQLIWISPDSHSLICPSVIMTEDGKSSWLRLSVAKYLAHLFFEVKPAVTLFGKRIAAGYAFRTYDGRPILINNLLWVANELHPETPQEYVELDTSLPQVALPVRLTSTDMPSNQFAYSIETIPQTLAQLSIQSMSGFTLQIPGWRDTDWTGECTLKRLGPTLCSYERKAHSSTFAAEKKRVADFCQQIRSRPKGAAAPTDRETEFCEHVGFENFASQCESLPVDQRRAELGKALDVNLMLPSPIWAVMKKCLKNVPHLEGFLLSEERRQALQLSTWRNFRKPRAKKDSDVFQE